MLGTFFFLAATTGARRGELLALRWRDVDLDGASIGIQRALVDGANGPVLAPTKTRRGHRVALDVASTAALAALRVGFEESAEGAVDLDRFVFTKDPDGLTPWLPNWVTKSFIRCRRSLNLEHFRLHDLRHFMATQMLNDGVPIALVASRLAHVRASTTLNVYAHATPGGDREAAEALARRLLGESS
jgi:integrase